MIDFRVGDLVLSDTQAQAEPLGVLHQVGIVVAKRRTDCLVQYPHLDRGAWFTADQLVPVGVKLEGTGKLLELISRVAHHLEAEEIELTLRPGQLVQLIVTHHGVSLEGLSRLRDIIGPIYVSMVLEPAGMTRQHCELRFHTPK